jgi:hypothetical protein
MYARHPLRLGMALILRLLCSDLVPRNCLRFLLRLLRDGDSRGQNFEQRFGADASSLPFPVYDLMVSTGQEAPQMT